MERRYQPTTYTVIVQRLDSTKVGAFGTFGQLGMVLNKGERRIPRTCNLFSDACFPSKKKLSTNTLLPVSLYLDRVDRFCTPPCGFPYPPAEISKGPSEKNFFGRENRSKNGLDCPMRGIPGNLRAIWRARAMCGAPCAPMLHPLYRVFTGKK